MSNTEPKHIDGLAVIVSVYIGNNLNEQQVNVVIECFKQVRHLYPDATIVIVDNKSNSQYWAAVAQFLLSLQNVYILENDSDTHRFEVGGYRLALQYIRADEYIFMHQNMCLHKPINVTLKTDAADACAFFSDRTLNCDANCLQVINAYLGALNMTEWNDDPLVICNSFYCNDLFIDMMLDDGVMDLPCNSKIVSNAYERIFGVYMHRKLGYVNVMDKDVYTKYYFRQY